MNLLVTVIAVIYNINYYQLIFYICSHKKVSYFLHVFIDDFQKIKDNRTTKKETIFQKDALYLSLMDPDI